MPFVEMSMEEVFDELSKNDPGFREDYENSREEFEILGQIIKLRKQKGLSQKELAQKIGKKQQVISRIEQKEHSPSLATLSKLARALDFEVKLVPKQEYTVK